MSESIVILGANSGIARALANQLAEQRDRLLLAGRDVAELEKTAADLRIRRQIEVHVESFRAEDYDGHAPFVDRCTERFGDTPDGVVLCYGELPDQEAAFCDPVVLRRSIDVNLTSAMVVLNLFAARLAARRRGFIAALSSVAGDRGRRSNFIYGAAKAGLTAYLSGLRSRLSIDGVHVLTVKPGQVDTKMTLGLVKRGSPLVASPERVAGDIARAIRRRRNVVYTPWFWRCIMAMIRLVPEPIFKRLKF